MFLFLPLFRGKSVRLLRLLSAIPCTLYHNLCIENILSSTEGLSVNIGRFYLLVWCFWFIGRVTSPIPIQSIKGSFASDPVPDIVPFHSATIVLLLFF